MVLFLSVDPSDNSAEMHKLVEETNHEKGMHIDEDEYAFSQLFPELHDFHSVEEGDSDDGVGMRYEISNQSRRIKFN